MNKLSGKAITSRKVAKGKLGFLVSLREIQWQSIHRPDELFEWEIAYDRSSAKLSP